MGDGKPLSMNEKRSRAQIDAEREKRRPSFKPEHLLFTEADGMHEVHISDYKQDPATGRYIIPYVLNSTVVPDKLLYGEAELFHDGPRQALAEIQNEIQAHIPVQFKKLEETTAAEKGKRFVQYNQGDVDISWTDTLGVNYVGGVMNDTKDTQRSPEIKQTVVIDNDWRGQVMEAMDSNYWKKGGEGWTKLAHETLHTLGLKDANHVNSTLRPRDTIMAYDSPVTLILGDIPKDIRKLDWDALKLKFGDVSNAGPAEAQKPDIAQSMHPSGLPSEINPRHRSPHGTSMNQKPR